MTRETTDTCASCCKFPINDAQNNAGIATCAIFEREQHYADRACGPLYERDRINLDA